MVLVVPWLMGDGAALQSGMAENDRLHEKTMALAIRKWIENDRKDGIVHIRLKWIERDIRQNCSVLYASTILDRCPSLEPKGAGLKGTGEILDHPNQPPSRIW